MKFVKKNDLKYKDGYFINKDNEVVMPGFAVCKKLDHLEHAYQHAKYDKKVIEMQAANMKDIPEFVFEHERESKIELPKVSTPTLDKKAKEALKILDENNQVETNKKLKKDLAYLSDIVEFVCADEILIEEEGSSPRLDLKYVGNPLELTKDKLLELLTYINE